MANESGTSLTSPRASLTAHNPYAPPAVSAGEHPEPRTDGAPSFNGTLKWIYSAAAVVAEAMTMLDAAGESNDALIPTLIDALSSLVAGVTALLWVAAAWRVRPWPRAHRDVSPSGAVWRFFIPFYGLLYWMFAANRELAASVEDRTRGNDVREPSNLARVVMTACVLELLAPTAGALLRRASILGGAYLGALVSVAGCGAWILFMFMWERRRALAASRTIE